MRAMPRIVMVSGAAPPLVDGVGDYTRGLLAVLAETRPAWNWWHLTRRRRWYSPPIERRNRVVVLRPVHGWTGRGVTLAARALGALRPDLLHVQEQIHSFYETDAAVRIAEAAKCPVVTTLHEFHSERDSVRHTVALVRRSAAVLANDQRTTRRCVAYTGRAPDLVAWSPSNVPPPLPEWRVSPVPGLLVTFGQLNAIKALEVVFAAFRELHARRAQLRWRLIGPFTPAGNPYHATLAERLAHHAVEFTGGFRDSCDRRLRTLLGEGAVALLPFVDGASLRRTSLASAWTFGLPVITTPPLDTEPGIADGRNCLLVQADDPAAWVTAIERVLDDEALASRLRVGGLETARAHDWQNLAALHVAIYDRLLGGALG